MSSITMKSSIEKAFGIKLVTSSRMEDKIELWRRMYEDDPLWMQEGVEPLGVPAAIAGEIARLVTVEMVVEVTGSQMGIFINNQLQPHLNNAKFYTEFACAKGAVAFKPFYNPTTGKIETTVCQADEFWPTRFTTNGQILGAVFPDQVVIGDVKFTRLERHELIGTNYVIENKCYAINISDFSTEHSDNIGEECLLTDVEEWKNIKPYTVITNVTKPMFAYFKMPIANTDEPKSPIGVSVYDRAWKRIRRADDQWARIWWEYKATEAAIHADEDLFMTDKRGNIVMEQGPKRLYRTVEGLKEQIHEFAPAIRDISLFNGLQHSLRVIEFQSNLAYGTLSDPNEVDKTAEEIRSSKHRSFSFVCDVQKAFKTAHEDLIEAIHTMAVVYGLCPDGDYESKFDFDDSIAVDRTQAFNEQMQMVAAGMLKPELFVSWYYGVSPEEAVEMIPPAFDATPDDLDEDITEE